jgi:hypothetical protein
VAADQSTVINFAWENYENFIGEISRKTGLSGFLWQLASGQYYFDTDNNNNGDYTCTKTNLTNWQSFESTYILNPSTGRAHIQDLAKIGLLGALFSSGQAYPVGTPCKGTTFWDSDGDGIFNPAPIDGNTALASYSDDDGGYIRIYGARYYSAGTVPVAPPSLLTISHFVDGGGWRSSILLVNNDVVPATYTVSFHNDAGLSYTPTLSEGFASGTIAVGGSTILETPDSSTTLASGWAQVSSSQAIGGTAVFRYEPWNQEAAVPLLTSGAMKLEIPYQMANGLTLGVALANPSASTDASITEIIRDLNGNQLASRTFTLQALNHNSFLPTIPAGITGGGVVEYDSNVNIYGLGIRSAPQGTGLAFTSLDAARLEPASNETISHIADGGGWKSTIILVNTAIVPASYTVNFWNDSGAAYAPPLAMGAVSGSIPVGGTAIIATADTSSTVSEGWATVTSAQSLGGTAVFRYDPWSQEAAVPLLPSGGVHLEIPYQVGNNLTLGIALANPSATQTANITEVIRDQNGNQLATRAFTLGGLEHTTFIPTYPATATGGGVAEYDSDLTIYGPGDPQRTRRHRPRVHVSPCSIPVGRYSVVISWSSSHTAKPEATSYAKRWPTCYSGITTRPGGLGSPALRPMTRLL